MTNAKHAGARHTSARHTAMLHTGSVITTLVALLCASCGGQAAPGDDGAGGGEAASHHGDFGTALVSSTPPAAPSSACDTFTTFEKAGSSACLSCVESSKCADARTLLLTEEGDGHTCPAVETDCQACAMDVPSPATCTCWDACLGACQPAFDAVFQCLVAECAAACT